MPKKAKDEQVIEEKKKTKKATKPKVTAVTKKAVTKKTSTKKNTTKKSEAKTTPPKKVTTKKTEAKTSPVKKETTKKASKSESKTTTTKKASVKKSNKSATSKKSTQKKSSSTKVSSKKSSIKNKKIEIIEYYDLPYKYNKTVVKLLAQTPTTLFVYWEISDIDKDNFINNYGEYFFNNTKPVLIIHNRTLNYSFEIDINDFANSWYIHVKDSNCDYDIELGRRGINKYIDIPNNYLFISNSNEIESPNDHILFEKLPNRILFKNVKTNYTIEKANLYYLAKIKSTYNIKDFYKNMYKDEDFDFDKLTLKNPSSSSPSY